MKFYCDNCSTKYLIGDEKVRGKILRIRCKVCDHIIVVKEPSRPAAEAQQSLQNLKNKLRTPTATPAPAAGGRVGASPSASFQWYYSVAGQNHGPLSWGALCSKFRSGDLGDEAYVWNKSMKDWLPAKDNPELRTFFQSGQVRRPHSPTITLNASDIRKAADARTAAAQPAAAAAPARSLVSRPAVPKATAPAAGAVSKSRILKRASKARATGTGSPILQRAGSAASPKPVTAAKPAASAQPAGAAGSTQDRLKALRSRLGPQRKESPGGGGSLRDRLRAVARKAEEKKAEVKAQSRQAIDRPKAATTLTAPADDLEQRSTRPVPVGELKSRLSPKAPALPVEAKAAAPAETKPQKPVQPAPLAWSPFDEPTVSMSSAQVDALVAKSGLITLPEHSAKAQPEPTPEVVEVEPEVAAAPEVPEVQAPVETASVPEPSIASVEELPQEALAEVVTPEAAPEPELLVPEAAVEPPVEELPAAEPVAQEAPQVMVSPVAIPEPAAADSPMGGLALDLPGNAEEELALEEEVMGAQEEEEFSLEDLASVTAALTLSTPSEPEPAPVAQVVAPAPLPEPTPAPVAEPEPVVEPEPVAQAAAPVENLEADVVLGELSPEMQELAVEFASVDEAAPQPEPAPEPEAAPLPVLNTPQVATSSSIFPTADEQPNKHKLRRAPEAAKESIKKDDEMSASLLIQLGDMKKSRNRRTMTVLGAVAVLLLATAVIGYIIYANVDSSQSASAQLQAQAKAAREKAKAAEPKAADVNKLKGYDPNAIKSLGGDEAKDNGDKVVAGEGEGTQDAAANGSGNGAKPAANANNANNKGANNRPGGLGSGVDLSGLTNGNGGKKFGEALSNSNNTQGEGAGGINRNSGGGEDGRVAKADPIEGMGRINDKAAPGDDPLKAFGAMAPSRVEGRERRDDDQKNDSAQAMMLTREQLNVGFVNIRKSVFQCVEKHTKRSGMRMEQSKVRVTVTIANTGQVQAVNIDAGLRNTIFGACMQAHTSRWRFPQFTGTPMKVKRAFVIQ